MARQPLDDRYQRIRQEYREQTAFVVGVVVSVFASVVGIVWWVVLVTVALLLVGWTALAIWRIIRMGAE